MSRNTTIAFSFFAVVYVALQFVPELRVHWMFKVFPIVLLIVEVSKDLEIKKGKLLFGALIASAAGDGRPRPFLRGTRHRCARLYPPGQGTAYR